MEDEGNAAECVPRSLLSAQVLPFPMWFEIKGRERRLEDIFLLSASSAKTRNWKLYGLEERSLLMHILFPMGIPYKTSTKLQDFLSPPSLCPQAISSMFVHKFGGFLDPLIMLISNIWKPPNLLSVGMSCESRNLRYPSYPHLWAHSPSVSFDQNRSNL